MANIWKEEYSIEKAKQAGIHGHEGRAVIGNKDTRWIYYVEVLDFRFAFFSINIIDDYIDYFERDILPSTRTSDSSPFSNGPAASIGDGQSPFERLPAWLRKKNKRPKILKALRDARNTFLNEL